MTNTNKPIERETEYKGFIISQNARYKDFDIYRVQENKNLFPLFISCNTLENAKLKIDEIIKNKEVLK